MTVCGIIKPKHSSGNKGPKKGKEININSHQNHQSMTTTANQSASAMNLTMVSLANIQPSAYNPRKHYSEESLTELAESIRQQGVLQPIKVRPLADTDRYEIIFGERRYRAAQIAGLAEIPATIADYSDEEAEEIAITENLHREDVTPIEEANAYQRLIDSGRHDVSTLAILFGKCENYIRSRLKFTALIPEIADLMSAESISIGVANEICRYGEDIQREVYEQHLKAGGYNNWLGMKATDIAEAIQRNYTTDLERYRFDKSVCAQCPSNTNHLLLFSDGGCGNCTNRKCLAERVTSHIVDEAIKAVDNDPLIVICQRQYTSSAEAVNRLKDMGYDVVNVDYVTRFPYLADVPKAEDFDTNEELEAALVKYDEAREQHNEAMSELNRKREDGEVTFYVEIGSTDISFGYIRNDRSNTSGEKEESPIEKLDKKDARNKEIAEEKAIADTKKKILEVNMTDTKFSADEERMVYYFLLSSLRKEHYSELGVDGTDYYLTEELKMKIVSNLTARTKAIIRRDYLLEKFKDTTRGTAVATMFRDFAKKHMADELAVIESVHNEVYDKRHQRIEEKKAALIKEQEKEDTPQEASETTEPTEAETQEIQTEETAA